jgi:predicted alpha/beta hydrolase
MLQWRKWCLNPQYSVGAEGESARLSYGKVSFPVTALSITDDELMTWRGTQNLINLYANAPRTFERIAPADLQVRRIGHFRFLPRAVQQHPVAARPADHRRHGRRRQEGRLNREAAAHLPT